MSTAGQYEFRDGALFLKAPSVGELRLRWRPVPEAHMRLANGHWHLYNPEFRILAPVTPVPSEMANTDKENLQAKYEAFQAFRMKLPDSLAQAVEPFVCHQWPLMTLLNRSIAARDLVKTNPLLAYALANNEHLRQGGGTEHASAAATRYSKRPQREILGWLGFPDTEAMVRILKKLPLAIVYPGLLRKLRQCTSFPEILKSFGHLPVINTGVIFLASHPDMAALVTPKLLLEVAGMDDEELSAPTADLLSEAITLANRMNRLDRLRPLISSRKVLECRDGLVRDYVAFQEQRQRDREAKQVARDAVEPTMGNRVIRRVLRRERPVEDELDHEKRARFEKFPPPPIPGTATIIPLQTFSALETESNEQNNCVGRSFEYAKRIMTGTLYIYKVLAPEHHTLSVVKYGNNCWTIGELKGFENAMGTRSAYIMVRAWRDANQISL